MKKFLQEQNVQSFEGNANFTCGIDISDAKKSNRNFNANSELSRMQIKPMNIKQNQNK